MTTARIRGAAGLALLLLCVANFLDAMDVSTIGVALPAIQTELGLAPTSLQWAVSAYVLGYGGFLLLGGKVADIYGHRRVFLWSLAVFGVASLAGFFVDNGVTLIAARLIKGIAAAFTAPAAVALMLSVFTEREARAKALGIFASTSAAGFVLGLVLGGAMTIISWRATLVMAGPVALLVLAISPFALPADKPRTGERHSFDWAGAITITPGLLLFVFGITNAAMQGWEAPLTWGSLVAAVVLVTLFLWVESRHGDPMVPLSFFKRAKVTHAVIVAFLFQGSYVAFQFVATLYYQDVLGWSPLITGAGFAIGGASVMFLAPRFAGLAARTGTTRLMTIGAGLLMLGYVFWAATLGNIDPVVMVVVSQLLMGLGYASIFPSVQVAALADIEEEKSGLASGLLFASFQIGGGVVLAVISAVFAAAPAAGWSTYGAGAAAVAVLSVGVTLVAALGPRVRRASRTMEMAPQAAE